MNELIHSTSPYLLQHAHNPVHWVEWNSAALERARREDKPILVSIGYSSCHWCHVMERESFEVEDIARVMNDYFVCIKIDREERPDIDQIYMEAVQAMGGHGGWPLNVFLTPDQKPFYGGTYFPPERWIQLLRQIHATYVQKRSELEENAEQLTRHINMSDVNRFSGGAHTDKFSKQDAEPLFAVLNDRFDTVWGGIEKAPKFVMPSIWLFLLRYHAMTKNPEALDMVVHTLIKMQQAGLYDQLGGGFSRYAVDGQWFAPHFEKMLYDNAQLLTLYSEAYSWTKNDTFRKIVYETTDWLRREMTHAEGGFYSALDADSENVEGKFYTWTWAELEEVLGPDTAAVAEYFHCTKEGNWEHGRNILMDTSASETTPFIRTAKNRMLEKRASRIRPGLDDKILTGWNAMTITGLTDAYHAFGDERFLSMGESAIVFLEKNMIADSKVHRSFRQRVSPVEAFLEDYALLIEAYTALYQCTFNEEYLTKAQHWTDYVLKNFSDGDGFLNFTGTEAETLIARKKEIFDNVIPGSNSIMARNLFRLGAMLAQPDWKGRAVTMLSSLKEIVQKEPGYLSNWGILMIEVAQGLAEIVIMGPEAEQKRKTFAAHAIPLKVMLGATGKSELPLLQDRESINKQTRIFVCYDRTCQLPVTSVGEAIKQLKN